MLLPSGTARRLVNFSMPSVQNHYLGFIIDFLKEIGPSSMKSVYSVVLILPTNHVSQ